MRAGHPWVTDRLRNGQGTVTLSPIDNENRLALHMRLAPVVLVAAALLAISGSAHAETESGDAPFVLVGVPDLFWEELSATDTPHTWELASRSAVGQISVRSVYSTTCPIDGWLTVSAGQRAATPPDPTADSDVSCPPASGSASEGVPADWSEVSDWNSDTVYSAAIGALGETLRDSNQSLLAVGPGAAVALANERGDAAPYVDGVEQLTGDTFDNVDVAAVDLMPSDTPEEMDARIRQVLDAIPSDATVVVFGAGSTVGSKRLQAVLMSEPGIDQGVLTSNSTREDGLVVLTDLTATVLAGRGLTPADDMVGAPIEVLSEDAALAGLATEFTDRNTKASTYASLMPPLFHFLLVLQLLLYGAATYVFRRRSPSRAAADDVSTTPLRRLAAVALFCSLIPFAGFGMNLLRWWQLPYPKVAAVLSIVLLVALLGTLIRAAWPHDAIRQVGAVAVATACLIAFDLVFGGALQRLSLLGYSPIIAGRFYGLGNVAFAVFASSSIFAAMWAAEETRRRGLRQLPVAVVIGLFAITVTGAPALGADLGGVLSLTCGFGVLILALAGVRLTAKRVTAVVLLALTTVFAISFLDWLRPADARTHLGSFFDSVLTGDALNILARKAEANLNVLTGNWLTLLLPVAVAFVLLVLLRDQAGGPAPLARAFAQVPALRPGLIGWLVTMTVGLVVNDSGVVVPAVGLMLVVPFLIVISANAVRSKEFAP